MAVSALARIGLGTDARHLAVSPGGLIAALSCARLALLVRGEELVGRWLLPCSAVLLHWLRETLLAVCCDGSAWLLSEPPASSSASARKRARQEGAGRRAQPVGDGQRAGLPPLGDLEAASVVASSLLLWRSDGSTVLLPLPADCGAVQTRPPCVTYVSLEALAGAQVPLVLAVHRVATTTAGTPLLSASTATSVPLDPALFYSVFGASTVDGDALLVASRDALGILRCTTSTEISSADEETATASSAPTQRAPLLAAICQPIVCILAPLQSSSSPAAARTIVMVGQHGALLLLTVGRDGRQHRQLWRLPPATVLGGCVLGGTLVVLTSGGAYTCTLPLAEPAEDSQSAAGAPVVGGSATATAAAAVEAAESAMAFAVEASRCGLACATVLTAKRGRTASPLDMAPDADVTPLALAPLPLMAAPFHGADDRLAILDIHGTLTTVRLDNGRLPSPPGTITDGPPAAHLPIPVSAAATESSECFVSSRTELCLRERLRRVGESTVALAEHERTLERAEQRLDATVAAHDALAAIAAARADVCCVQLSDNGLQLLMRMHNPSTLPLGEAWCLTATLRRVVSTEIIPAATTATSIGPAEAAVSSTDAEDGEGGCTSTCVPLGGLPAGGHAQFALTLPPHAWLTPMRLAIFMSFRAPADLAAAGNVHGSGDGRRAGGPGGTSTVACALVHLRTILLHQTLRRRACWMPSPTHSEAQLHWRIRQALIRQPTTSGTPRIDCWPAGTGAPGLAAAAGETRPATYGSTGGVNGSASGRGGGGVSPCMAIATTQCKLKLRSMRTAPSGGGSGGRGGVCTDWLLELLECSAAASTAGGLSTLLGGKGANASANAHVQGGRGAARQASLALELPSGTAVTLRVSIDTAESAGGPGGGVDATGGASAVHGTLLQLLMQCEEPAKLWALRASLLDELSRRVVSSPVTSPAGAAPAEDAEHNNNTGASPAGTADALLPRHESMRQEARAFCSQLRKWQLAHARLHDDVYRCFDLRRRFERGAEVVSLQALSLETMQQSKRALELHQAIRDLGCLTLTVG